MLGSHTGAYAYTVGQRAGLDLTGPAPDGRPRYVLSITPKTNTVTVGPAEALEVSTGARQPSGLDRRPAARRAGRVRGAAAGARRGGAGRPSTVDGDTLHAELRRPARGVAAGQAMVAYRPDPAGDVVLGSATITG